MLYSQPTTVISSAFVRIIKKRNVTIKKDWNETNPTLVQEILFIEIFVDDGGGEVWGGGSGKAEGEGKYGMTSPTI